MGRDQHGRSNASTPDDLDSVEAPRALEMEAYDSLPKLLRDMLKWTTGAYSCIGLYEVCRQGVELEFLVETILATDNMLLEPGRGGISPLVTGVRPMGREQGLLKYHLPNQD